LPGRLLRVVVVRRPCREPVGPGQGTKPFGRHKPLEAFCSTDVSLSLADILAHYQERWAIEIDIRDARAFSGLAQDQCRKRQHIVGANTLRLLLRRPAPCGSLRKANASGVSSCVACGRGTGTRWHRASSMWLGHVVKLSGRWGFFPYLGFFTGLDKNQQGSDEPLLRAA
jgi:hypothetical protein